MSEPVKGPEKPEYADSGGPAPGTPESLEAIMKRADATRAPEKLVSREGLDLLELHEGDVLELTLENNSVVYLETLETPLPNFTMPDRSPRSYQLISRILPRGTGELVLHPTQQETVTLKANDEVRIHGAYDPKNSKSFGSYTNRIVAGLNLVVAYESPTSTGYPRSSGVTYRVTGCNVIPANLGSEELTTIADEVERQTSNYFKMQEFLADAYTNTFSDTYLSGDSDSLMYIRSHFEDPDSHE